MNRYAKIILASAIVLGLGIWGIALANTVNNAPALFETSLATAISNNATSVNLSSGVLRDGTTLTGPVCLTVDSGLSNTEFMCGIASGTVVSNLIRGLGEDGSTTFIGLEYSHRYGADVKVTDFPYLQQILNFLQGLFSLPNPLVYSSSVTNTSLNANPQNLASVAYVASTSFVGTPNATYILQGATQLATTSQLATGQATGTTGAYLVAPSASHNQSPPLVTMGAPTLVSSTSGGSMASNTYYYVLTQTNNYGQSTKGVQASVNTSGTVASVALSWQGISGASYYSVYRSTSTNSYVTPSFIASTTATTYTDTASNTIAGAPPSTMAGAVSVVPVTTASGTLADGFIGQGAGDAYNFLGQITSASTTLNGTTTFSGVASSSLVGTNSNSQLVAMAQGASTGSILQYYNGKWNAGLGGLMAFSTSSVTVSSTRLVIGTTTFPLASTSSVYQFSMTYSGSGQPASTTIFLSNGNGSTTLATCNNGGTANPVGYLITGQIWMQNSTSSEILTAFESPNLNCTVNTAAFLNESLSINFATTTSLNVSAVVGNGSTITFAANGSVYMIQ